MVEWFKELYRRERKIYSQHGEEGVIEHIFKHIDADSQFLVDIGASNGSNASNSKWLLKNGWTGLLIDKENQGNTDVKEEFVTAENINDILNKYGVPKNIDFLSIDIDCNDYWVLKSIFEQGDFLPKLVCSEFNPNFDPNESKAIPYCTKPKGHGTIYYGASIRAFYNLAKDNGYNLIHSMQTPDEGSKAGRNVFLLKNDYLPEGFDIDPSVFHPIAWKEAYKKTKVKGRQSRRERKFQESGDRHAKFNRIFDMDGFIDV